MIINWKTISNSELLVINLEEQIWPMDNLNQNRKNKKEETNRQCILDLIYKFLVGKFVF